MKLQQLRKSALVIYEYISYRGTSESDDHREKDYFILINQYFFLLFVIFLMQGFASLLLLGFKFDVIVLWLTSFASVFAITYHKKYIINKNFITIIFIYLTLIITYYSSVTGVNSGCYLYFFSLLSAIPIFFSTKKDKKFITVIFLFVLSSIYLSAIANFQLWGKQEYFMMDKQLGQKFLIVNITCQILLLSINYFFLEEKRNDYYNTLLRNKYKKSHIENLTNELQHLRNVISKEEINDEELRELIEFISINEIMFLEKFDKFFPYFKTRLLHYSKIQLSTSEIILCAALKLGLSTKEIAIHSNSSLKAVEGRRYRLRKKLNIPSEVDFTFWFLDF